VERWAWSAERCAQSVGRRLTWVLPIETATSGAMGVPWRRA
jgi:hypothetical protein